MQTYCLFKLRSWEIGDSICSGYYARPILFSFIIHCSRSEHVNQVGQRDIGQGFVYMIYIVY